MDAAQLVANALPFMMAYVIMLLKSGIPQIAESTFKLVLPEGVSIEGTARKCAVDLAVHVYRQLSFILSVLLSTVSALALTLTSQRRVLAVLVTFTLLTVIAVWVMRWQTLSANPQQRARRDKEMGFTSFATTTIMLLATLYARGVL
ncbi:MAG: hypothetical protein M3362_01775 [Acidobacteriota bacterium]|nr:hypothetical protein [Acidobacteriota bacterium]